MSHFTVLVPGKDQEELKRLLLPYHEYECTGIEEYTEWVLEVPFEKAEARAQDIVNNEWVKKQPTMHEEYTALLAEENYETIFEKWEGLIKGEGGYGCKTNTDARWDWWLLGGRWTGSLLLKKDAGNFGVKGEPGLMTPTNTDPHRADVAKISDLDLETLREEGFVTHAFIDLEGKWNQHGSMGWFAIVTDESPDYDEEFWRFIDSLEPEQHIAIVDCHI